MTQFATAFWDLCFAVKRRKGPPAEGLLHIRQQRRHPRSKSAGDDSADWIPPKGE